MSYIKTNWQNLPDTSTPINATNLNHIEQGIYDNATDIATNTTNIQSNTTNINAMNTFDNTEKVVGTWVDGKPLYRKTYTINNPGSGEWTYSNSISDLDVAMFDKSHTFLLRTNGTVVCGIGADGNSDYWFDARMITSTGNLMFYVGQSINTGSTIYATILYTKTTD